MSRLHIQYVIDQEEMKTAVCILGRTVVVIGQFKFEREREREEKKKLNVLHS